MMILVKEIRISNAMAMMMPARINRVNISDEYIKVHVRLLLRQMKYVEQVLSLFVLYSMCLVTYYDDVSKLTGIREGSAMLQSLSTTTRLSAFFYAHLLCILLEF